MRKRRAGLIPHVGGVVLRVIRWTLSHPQPFAVLGIAAVCGLALRESLARSEAFRITTVRLPAQSPVKVPDSVIGQNLWTIDLKALAEDLRSQRPDLKRVRVTRLLPDTLQVETVARKPIAQLKLGQWHAVDRDGFIFPRPSQTVWNELVIVKGLEEAKPLLKVGRENAHEQLLLALRMVSRLQASPTLAGHRLTAVQVGNPKQLSFLIDDDIEIRCGDEPALDRHLDRLRTVLRSVSRNQVAIRYIDMRFQDPVVGPRT